MKGSLVAITVVNCAILVARISADDKLPVLKVGSQTYSNVTVLQVTATDLFFTAGKAMANAKLKDLDPELQKRFHFDPAKAEAIAQARKAAAAVGTQSGAKTNLNAGRDAIKSSMNDAAIKAEMEAAILKVREIVNRPVKSVAITPNMSVATYSPGWFHDGAEKPEFSYVDIRTSQQLSYEKNEYVTSDLNPGIAFHGRELEFNPMTKYFYVDRSVPKAKLTEEEMLKINQLYRIIGGAEEELARRRLKTQ